MEEITVTEFREYLQSLDKARTDKFLVKLFKENPFVRRCASYQYLGKEYGKQLLEEYKKKVYKEIHKKSSEFSLRTLNEFVSSLKKETDGNEEYYGELLLYYDEELRDIFIKYNLYDAACSRALVKNFNKITKIASKNQYLFERWKDRMIKLVNVKEECYDRMRDTMREDYNKIPWVKDPLKKEW